MSRTSRKRPEAALHEVSSSTILLERSEAGGRSALINLSRGNGFPNEANDSHRVDANEFGAKKGPESQESALERHYTVKEIAEMWQLDEKMIRRVFGDEPGVVSLGSNESRFRRAYRTLRIPESVLVRVHRRLRRAG